MALLLALPGAAHACAVCGAAVERNRSAFLGTTILLSLLPLGLIAACLWWLRREAAARAAGEGAGTPDPGLAVPGRPGGGREG